MTKCIYCGDELDQRSHDVWRHVHGWERKAHGQSRRSGSDIVLREPLDQFACAPCIHLRRAGIAPGQGTLA